MRYIMLIHHDQAKIDAIASDELTNECAAYDSELEAAGKLVLAHALYPAATGKSVRYRRKPQITDGPFAETKEQIIGLVIIEAKDEAEALEIAARSPLARTGSVELRRAYDIRSGKV